jgi:hypothetical protein
MEEIKIRSFMFGFEFLGVVLDPVRSATNIAGTETVTTESDHLSTNATSWFDGFENGLFADPTRAEKHVLSKSSAEYSAAVYPTAVSNHTLTHLFIFIFKN